MQNTEVCTKPQLHAAGALHKMIPYEPIEETGVATKSARHRPQLPATGWLE